MLKETEYHWHATRRPRLQRAYHNANVPQFIHSPLISNISWQQVHLYADGGVHGRGSLDDITWPRLLRRCHRSVHYRLCSASLWLSAQTWHCVSRFETWKFNAGRSRLRQIGECSRNDPITDPLWMNLWFRSISDLPNTSVTAVRRGPSVELLNMLLVSLGLYLNVKGIYLSDLCSGNHSKPRARSRCWLLVAGNSDHGTFDGIVSDVSS